MPQWDYPYNPPYSIYQCERPCDQVQGLIRCGLRQPLKSPDHIRLLKIYPPGWPNRMTERLSHDDDNRIQCDVFQVSLASMTTPNRPYFATLSYAWGNPGVTRKIRCAKETVSVTLNLYEALVHVRNLRTPRLLWVDSLCINQADKLEKGQQVQRMHLVYGQSHCISWMGVESEDGFDVQSMLPIIRWLSETEEDMNVRRISPTWDNLDDHIEQNPVYGVTSARQIPWTQLLHCLDRDIFKRLWCVQEILLARSNDVRTSRCRVDIAVLARSSCLISHVLSNLQSTSTSEGATSRSAGGTPVPDVRRLRTTCSRISSMLMTAPLPCLEFKKAADFVTHVTALSIIHDNVSRECSDPRDHIYGLAALCNLGTSYNISYSTLSLTTQEVFTDFTLHSLRTTKLLEAFQLVYRSAVVRENTRTDITPLWKHRPWTPGLPTWVPDFAGPQPIIRKLKNTDDSRETVLRASKDRPAQLTRLSRQQIGVIGVEIGTIQVCGIALRGSRDQDTAAESASYVWQYFSSLQRSMDTIESSISAQSLCRQLLDVLSTGRAWRHCPAWAYVTLRSPGWKSDRMIQSSLGAAWIFDHLPGLASRAKLTLHRWIHPSDWRELADDVNTWLYSASFGTRLFTTDNVDAIIGTGPEGLRVGDLVCVLYGGDVPFILHPDGQGHYKLIGECYVSGIMQGEALNMGLEEREFLLV